MLKNLCSATALTVLFAAFSPASAIEPAAPEQLLDGEHSIGLSVRHQLDRTKRQLSKREKGPSLVLGPSIRLICLKKVAVAT